MIVRDALRVALAAALVALSGCGPSRREAQLAEEVAALRREVAALRQAMDEHWQKYQDAAKWYETIDARLAEWRTRAEDIQARIDKLVRLTQGRAAPEAEAMIAEIARKTYNDLQQEDEKRRRLFISDLEDRTMAELAAAADLSPAQVEKIKQYEREERENLRDAFMQTLQYGRAPAMYEIALRRAREDKEEKVRKVLSAEQFEKYRQFRSLGLDTWRGSHMRRVQKPDANQDDH